MQSASTIHQAKLVADAAAAQQVFAKRQQLGEDIIGYAHEIKIHALSRLGELLAAMPKATGGDAQRTRFRKSTESPPTLSDLGIDKKTSAVAQQLAVLPSETRNAVARRERSLRDVRNTQRRAERVDRINALSVDTPALETVRPVPVLYADPPWRYEHVKTENRAIENQYPTMSLDDICALPVGQASTDDAVLFLWATSPKLAESMRVIDAWGFTYRRR